MTIFARKTVVLFDAGGTLISLDYQRVRDSIGTSAKQPSDQALERAEAIARRWADDGVRRNLSTEQLWHGYFSRLLDQAGVESDKLTTIVDALWQANQTDGLWRRLIAEAPRVLGAIQQAGRRMAVVSNAEGQVAKDLTDVGLGDWLETVVDSHLVGVAKPDPRIFEIALERLGARAEDAVYVGDVPAFDVVGARAARIEPVLIDRYQVHPDADCPRIQSLDQLLPLLGIDAIKSEQRGGNEYGEGEC